MTPEYHVTHLQLLCRAASECSVIKDDTEGLRKRPYELIAQQSDGVLNHFAVGHGMQPLRKD